MRKAVFGSETCGGKSSIRSVDVEMMFCVTNGLWPSFNFESNVHRTAITSNAPCLQCTTAIFSPTGERKSRAMLKYSPAHKPRSQGSMVSQAWQNQQTSQIPQVIKNESSFEHHRTKLSFFSCASSPFSSSSSRSSMLISGW